MDYGHSESDRLLRLLERRLNKEYKQASKEAHSKLVGYFKKFEKKDAIKRAERDAGKITKYVEDYAKMKGIKEINQKTINDAYDYWRTGQIAVGERWKEMQETLAEDFHNVNNIASEMIKDHSHDVYALNHNYGTFEVERGSLVDTSYTLYDKSTVERLVRDNPDLLPPPGKKVSQRIREGKDVLWNKQLIQSSMTQSILQGESIPQIAKRLAESVGDSNRKAAIRNARTMTTGAENAGRVDSYKRAQKMGINMVQVWLATLDGRTRHSHRLMDGEKVQVDKKFSNGCRFPGDPQGAAHEVWNCRCTLIAEVDGVNYNLADDTQRNSKLGDMSYEEWKNEHSRIVPTKGMGDEYTGLDDNNNPVIAKFNDYMFKNHPEAFGDVGALKRRIQENYRRKFNSQIYMIENDPDAIALGYKYCGIDDYLNADFRKQLYLVPRFEDYYKHALAEYGHEYADSGSIMNSLFRYNIGATPDGYGKGKGARLIFDKETGLSDFIDNNPDVHYNGGTLYRGLMTNDKGIKDLEKAMTKGEPLSMRGVSSWSTNKNIAKDFSENSLRKSKNPVIFEDVSEGARNAMPFPYSSRGFTPQHEVIYSGSAEFDILEMQKENNVTYVKVKQRKK